MDLSTIILVTDDQNQNLLDPSTPGYFKPEDIRIYYVKDGQRKDVYQANLDTPRNFRIEQFTSAKEFAMVLYPDEGTRDGEITTTIIQWNDVAADTLECEVHHWDSSVAITRIWNKDELVYDKDNGLTQWDDTQVSRLVRLTK